MSLSRRVKTIERALAKREHDPCPVCHGQPYVMSLGSPDANNANTEYLPRCRACGRKAVRAYLAGNPFRF